MSKRRIQLVPAAVAVTLVLAACSGSNAGESAPEPTSSPVVPATRDEALAFCQASAELQIDLAALATTSDFDTAFGDADDSYDTWSRAIPRELLGVATPLLSGWDEVVSTFDDTGDPAQTGAALAELTTSAEFERAFAAFERFGDDNCVPDTTPDTEPTAAPSTAPAVAPTVPATTEPVVATTAPSPTTVAPGPAVYAGTGGRASVAALTVVAEQCDFPVAQPIGADEPDHWSAVGVVADRLFLAGQDGVEETGLVAYQLDADPSCRLLPAEGFGTDGILTLDEPIDHVSASRGGTVLASNAIFGTWAVDSTSGAALACGRGSRAEIAPDGTLAYGFFPGSGDLRRYDLADGCVVTDAALTVASQPNPSAAGWIGDDVFVIGGFLAGGGAGVTALDRAGNELWTVGGSPADLGDLGYGAISAVSSCAGLVCVVDSNFRTMHVLDAATGEQLGLVDLQELTGLRINWFNGLTEDPTTGALWLVGGLTQVDPDGNSSDRVQGLVYRLTLG